MVPTEDLITGAADGEEVVEVTRCEGAVGSDSWDRVRHGGEDTNENEGDNLETEDNQPPAWAIQNLDHPARSPLSHFPRSSSVERRYGDKHGETLVPHSEATYIGKASACQCPTCRFPVGRTTQ